MRAVRIHEYGGPEVLVVDEIAQPAVLPGQALVRVEAAGVNFIDIYHRTGQYPNELPLTLGQEAAGIVAAIADDVTDVRVGDRVAFAGVQGGYAEYVAAPAWRLVPIPPDVDFDQAAAVMLQGLTAHYLASDVYRLRINDVALVHAAAGGVGGLLVQLAKQRGARVIGTVSSEAKADEARALGADEVILYEQEDFSLRVRELTDGRGVDVVYDSVGRTTFDRSLLSLRPRGTLALYGQSSGAVPPFDLQILNARGSLFVTRPTLGHYTATRNELLARTNEIFGFMISGLLKVRIDRAYPLARVAEAQQALAARETRGKLVIEVQR